LIHVTRWPRLRSITFQCLTKRVTPRDGGARSAGAGTASASLGAGCAIGCVAVGARSPAFGGLSFAGHPAWCWGAVLCSGASGLRHSIHAQADTHTPRRCQALLLSRLFARKAVAAVEEPAEVAVVAPAEVPGGAVGHAHPRSELATQRGWLWVCSASQASLKPRTPESQHAAKRCAPQGGQRTCNSAFLRR